MSARPERTKGAPLLVFKISPKFNKCANLLLRGLGELTV
jgi:hypothetical protein